MDRRVNSAPRAGIRRVAEKGNSYPSLEIIHHSFCNNLEVAYDLTYWPSKGILAENQELTLLGGVKWQKYLRFWQTYPLVFCFLVGFLG
jgi:hypothetical protein